MSATIHPCGPAVKKLCERACEVFGQTEYATLATISVSHLYNLRKSIPYTRQRRHFEKTRPKPSKIGERRKPQPHGQPGYIRIDTVHPGDLDQHKGVYHINAVDEVTQFEVVCSVEKISERYLIPALEQLLETFPFMVLGFHSDNGSEYINKRVAELLEKLRIEFTKSRSRQSNDNALAKSKNGAVLRKLFGYSHIPQRWAPLINGFNRQHLNPYLNFHRPCFFPETRTDDKGKQRKIYHYENMMTPYDKLKSLPFASDYLKPGLSTVSPKQSCPLCLTGGLVTAEHITMRRKEVDRLGEESGRWWSKRPCRGPAPEGSGPRALTLRRLRPEAKDFP